MSATADATIEYFQKIGIDHRMYKIENSATNIRSLSFYRSEEVLEEFLSSIKKENKAIVFTKSATRAYELHKKFSDSVFVCSETGNSAYKRYVKKDKVEEMLNSEMFKEQFLFTTSTLDNGINFKDKSIKYIICDIEDIDILIQCIGRKRSLNGHDKVNIIVKSITNKEIYRKKKLAEELIEPALYLKNNDTAMYIRKYSKNDEASSNRLIYDRNIGDSLEYEKVVNEIKLYKVLYDIKIYDKMLSEENGFMNYLQDKLQQFSVSVIDDHCKITGLYDYLDNIVGQRLYKEEQKELISKIGLRDNYNRIQKSCDSLNSYFRNNKMPYHLRDKNRDGNRKLVDGSPNPKFNKTYWTLAKHIC
ncbi:hypothetical protein CS562_07055 [Paenibacillus sp. LK1]|nr:hypothetical protein CS562_07055 [Paenibacillus sp. LK1]